MNNICQGSQGYGFVMPHVKCSEIDSHDLGGNVAGSCQVGFIFNSIGETCQGFSRIGAYGCTIGQISAPPSTKTLIFKKFILLDNKRGGTLKFGSVKNSLNNTAIFNDSYISALSRPSCSYCYPSTPCQNAIGFRLLSVS